MLAVGVIEIMASRKLVYATVIIFVSLVVIITLMLIYGVSFGMDFSVVLPDNYMLAEVSGSTIGIAHNGAVVIWPDVDGYRLMQFIIVGHTSIAENQLLPSKPGYFLIETKSGKVYEGLEKSAWLSILRKRNIVSIPVLHRPSRFDPIFGYNRY